MKRRFCILIALILLLAGCGNAAQTEEAAVTVASSEESTLSSESIGETEDPHVLRMTQEENVRKATYEDKSAYTDFLAKCEKLFVIPGLKQVLTPQGIAVSPDTGDVYISSYSVDDVPSSISVTNWKTLELDTEYYLYKEDGSPFTSHVGGVAVTETHLYVSADKDSSGDYRIAAIPLTDLPRGGAYDITVHEYVTMAMSPSMMNYSNGYLWVGNFYHPNADYNLSPNMNYTTTAYDGSAYGCYILGFDMTEGHDRLLGEKRYPMPDVILAAPNRIQGVTFVGNTVVLSQSYGRQNDATLLSYQVDLTAQPDLELALNGEQVPAFLLDDHRQTGAVNSIPMSEGLATAADGRVLVLYESGAIRYQDGKHRTSYVWAMTIN